MGMTPQVFYIKQGNTLPAITATLVDQNNNVVNLTGATVYFHMTNGLYGNVINSQATIVNPTAGQVSYTWKTGDTNDCGTFSCEWYVVTSSGGQESFPQGFYNTVVIDPTLNNGFVPLVSSTPLFNTIWSSNAAPTNTQGNNGDFWFNTTNLFLYGPKANGVWPAGYLTSPAGAPLNSFGAPTGNVNMGGFGFTNLATGSFTSLDHLTLAPASTSQVGLVVDNPSGTSVDVADFQLNGVTYWGINSSGNLHGLGQLSLSPSSTSLTPLVVNSPSGTTVDVADFQVNGTTAWNIASTGKMSGTQPLVVAPTSTSAVSATFNNPTSTTADVADFQVNGTTSVAVTSSGNLAIKNSKQLDITAASSSPFIGNAATSYAVTWTNSAGANPSIGNGQLTGTYFKYGRMVTVHIEVYGGSTTTWGAGGSDFWQFSVPFTPVNIGSGNWPGSGIIYANSKVWGCMAALYVNGGTGAYAYGLVADTATIGAWDQVGSSAYTWGAGTSITLHITYESTT